MKSLRVFLLVGSLWAMIVCVMDASETGVDNVLIRLKPRVEVQHRLIRIGDVADLSGGLAPLRDQIARIDLAEVGEPKGIQVSRKQVTFRLQLAGIPTNLFRVEGAERIQIGARFRQITAEEVESQARKALLAQLPWPAEEVQIDLVQPVLAPLPTLATDEELIVKAELHPGQRPPGRVQMNVRLFVQGVVRLALPIYYNVRPCVQVAVCQRRIEKGEELTSASVYIERRPVDPQSRLILTPTAITGKKTRHALMPGQVILTSDVETLNNSISDPVLVRSQETVRLQIQVGGLRVTAAGTALQEGRRHQLIRVQNIDSKKILMGRVIDRSLVEVD
jgi:flagella basal body P-ring formation protein FlgA